MSLSEEERFAIEKEAIKGILQAFMMLSLVGIPITLDTYSLLYERVEAAKKASDLIPSDMMKPEEKNPLEDIDLSKINMEDELKNFFNKDKGE